MRRLILFLAVTAALLAAGAAFDWRVDPFGDIYKPGALSAALRSHPNCLVSQELVGARYFAYKLDVFHRRPTRTFVIGSSRVLEIRAHPGEKDFANLGFPGSSPETILSMFRALPARPAQTAYVGVESFWFNPSFVVPVYRPSRFQLAKYLLSWATFHGGYDIVRQAHYILFDRWRREQVGKSCVIGRIYPSIAWNVDGSRTWSWELDPQRFPRFHAPPFTTDLNQLRNGFYANWTSFDTRRVKILEQALALARARGWHVVGFAPPEPPRYLHLLDTDPRIAPQWHEYLRLMPKIFHRYGFRWVPLEDSRSVPCTASEFPDAFHTDAVCSARIRARLDAAAQ
jgi:hypothetical protein